MVPVPEGEAVGVPVGVPVGAGDPHGAADAAGAGEAPELEPPVDVGSVQRQPSMATHDDLVLSPEQGRAAPRHVSSDGVETLRRST